MESLIRCADHKVCIDRSLVERASNLEVIGFGAYDALYLACAEHAKVDIFLSTDDSLLKLANESAGLCVTRTQAAARQADRRSRPRDGQRN